MQKLNNTFIKEIVSNPKRRVDFELGDIKQPDFYPQFKTKHWDNEANFSIRLKEDDYQGKVKEKNGRIEWQKGVKIARFYELQGFEDGGFEFEVELSEKPETNILEFTIQTKGLDFFYQPELSAEEIAEGAIRPDDIVGSYAVYHKTRKGDFKDKQYKTGKAFHIYRPYVVDYNGIKEWCSINISEELGILTISIPQTYLDNAAYPIIIDPTFGYTTIGGTYTSSASDNVYVSEFSLGESGDITKITKYGGTNTGTQNHVAAIYTNSAGTPVTRQGDGTVTSLGTTLQWNDLPYPSAVSLAAGTYHLGFSNQTNTAYQYDVAGAYDRDSNMYPAPASWVATSGSGARTISVYATYTVASVNSNFLQFMGPQPQQ